MRGEWFCTYFNNTQIEYEIIKKFYINVNNENKIIKLIKNSDNTTNINKLFNDERFLKFKGINKYNILNGFIYSDIFEKIKNIKIENNSCEIKNIGILNFNSIEELE